jgi:Trp operon repressor
MPIQKLVSKLPVNGELLRGSLLQRTVRHSKDCPNARVVRGIKCLF